MLTKISTTFSCSNHQFHPCIFQSTYINLSFCFIFSLSDKNLSAPGAKRGRLLIRQSRIKKDCDVLSTTPTSCEEIDFDAAQPQSYSHRLLSVPSQHIKIERHVSEPAPRNSSPPPLSSMHLLSVPMHNPVLTKQHSHPLLPSQSSSCSIQYSQHYQQHPHLSLHRQLSYPGPSDTSMPDQAITPPSPIPSATNLSSKPSTSPPSAHSTPAQSFELQELSGSTIAPASIDAPRDLSPSSYAAPSETHSHSVDHVPSIRVKSEELQRSISSPQVSVNALRHFLFLVCSIQMKNFLFFSLQTEFGSRNFNRRTVTALSGHSTRTSAWVQLLLEYN